MSLRQFQIIQSLGEALSWFQKELSWGVPAAELNHLTGRIGELYTAMITYGQMATEVNQRGYDVVSAEGERISVKTITSSTHVSFNLRTFDQVDRIIVLRINTVELAIEILLNKAVAECRALMRGSAGKLIFPTLRPPEERLTRPLSEMVVVAEARYDDHLIKQYENGSVEVLTNGMVEPIAKPILRNIASEIQVDLINGAGSPKNTRQLGDHIIKKIRELNPQ
ncbi:DUF6998 domain-containing protein [Rhizobium sp. LEGMi135b]